MFGFMVVNSSRYLFEKLIAQEKTLLLIVLFIIQKNRWIFLLTKMAINCLVLEAGMKWMHTHRLNYSHFNDFMIFCSQE